MKKNIHKNLLGVLKSKGILTIAGGLILMSCGAQMGGYSETDGVYYDPNKDTLPEGVIINDRGNRVGEEYNYYQDDTNVVQNAEMNSREGKYDAWNNYSWNNTATDSDWGSYAGSQTNYYDNSWGWGGPWGWGMYGGYNPYWGWGGYGGYGWGLGLSWGGSWGWGGYGGWNMGWGYPWGGWYGAYNPYWGWGSPYGWGYGGGYWGGGYYAPNYRRSGANGRGFNSYNGSFGSKYGVTSGAMRRSNTNTGGFRNSGSNMNYGGYRSNSGGFRQGNTSGGFRNSQSGMRPQGGFRNPRPNYNYPQQSQPRYEGGFRNNGGGFNNSNSGGGFRSGGGGFGGGSGGGGGFRSGGGGGGGFRGGR
ncbi:prolyl-tRNA synthetase [uncultured Chryseobacterium sp.]|uniref:prolyl-tRNA synthetase n=1 Tax=uncultured Chryseobacterium sp. TaxID=259322 RepID=UPI0025F6A4DA|nr:prolyl-tRNA synthetase [uncultured Chryseobacterium sp.]